MSSVQVVKSLTEQLHVNIEQVGGLRLGERDNGAERVGRSIAKPRRPRPIHVPQEGTSEHFNDRGGSSHTPIYHRVPHLSVRETLNLPPPA